MVCHEVWDYDDSKRLATLKAFEIVCRDCDSVLHFGKSLLIGGERGDQAIKHLMKVNRITKKLAMSLIDEAFGLWMDRSKRKKWQIQIGQELISKHPALAGLTL